MSTHRRGALRGAVLSATAALSLVAALLDAREARAQDAQPHSLALGLGALVGAGTTLDDGLPILPVLQLRGIVEVPLTTSLTLRAQPTFQSSWMEDTTRLFYGIRVREQTKAHVLMLPLLLGLQPSPHVGVYVGPMVGVGFGHYEDNLCGGGWKRNVPFGGQADVVFRAEALGHLELGASAGVMVHNPIISCAENPGKLARIDGDQALLSVGLTAAYRFW